MLRHVDEEEHEVATNMVICDASIKYECEEGDRETTDEDGVVSNCLAVHDHVRRWTNLAVSEVRSSTAS